MAEFPYRARLAAGVAATVHRQRTIADLDVPLAVVEAQLAEQRHQYLDLDADSSCCLPGLACPACPPVGTVPPGGAR